MSQQKVLNTSRSSKRVKLFDPPLLLLLVISALGYYMAWAAIYTLFGGDVAAWLATPLWGIPVFFITRWDRVRTQQDVGWREFIKFPRLKVWKLIAIALTIFSIQYISGLLAGYYLATVRPDISAEGTLEGLQAIGSEWGSLIIVMAGAGSAYFLGGYVAGKISPDKYLAPYSHAAAGEFTLFFINYVWIQYLIVCECGTPPTQKDVGMFALLLPPTMSITIFGAWVATRRRSRRSEGSSIPFLNSSERGAGPESLTAHISSDQQVAAITKSEGKQDRIFTRKRRRGKRRRR